ncbi:MAG: HAMP domain-containing histidine kinase [Bacteroidia bacterium]|nr:HAMP domain-containing histidine kinase [Bacteroidia bacterium]
MRPLIIFYLLVVYIILQFVWWSYLLVDLNREILQQKIEISQLKDPNNENPDQVSIFEKEFNKKKMMVLGEGFVFLCLLVIGIIKTHQSFSKEFALAKQQQNFLLSVTHEFKSPLAAIKLNLETLEKHKLDENKREVLIDYAMKETDRINNLVENALIAAQFDSDKFDFVGSRFNLSECVEEIIKGRKIALGEAVEIRSNVQKDVYLVGDKMSIKSVVLNLIENAIKYSDNGISVDVSLKADNKEVTLLVADKGIGIDPKERPLIFQKFYRVGSEITRKTKGTGLGLYIVQKIVQKHNGKIRVKNNSSKGTVFEIVFPQKNT